MNNPVATYRLQFHKGFTLENLAEIIPYLQKLGIGTIYASPIFEATPGSTHGYDGVNPHRINPEVGSEEKLREVAGTLKGSGVNWLQDIVPNHMAFHPNNPWLMDVLEKGKKSSYAKFFDIGWSSKVYDGKLMVPFLGGSLEEVIRNGELKLAIKDNKIVFLYFDNAYPVNLPTYVNIFSEGNELPEPIQKWSKQADELSSVENPKDYASKFDELMLQIATLYKQEESKSFIEKQLKAANDEQKLLQIANEQNYQLCHWQETDHKINFRRFFTVNGLICLNIQDREVFDHYHKFIKSFIDDGVFQGIRIDHIDGLYDPTAYLEELRKIAGEETYVVVEKILEPGEQMPSNWPIQGETGYGFLSIVNNLFTNSDSEEKFTAFYHQLVGKGASIHDQIHEKKAYILQEHMQGEHENLLQLFLESALADENVLRETDHQSLKEVIGEMLIQCPVYRYYGNEFPLAEEENAALQAIFSRIRDSKDNLIPAVDLLEHVLLVRTREGNEQYDKRALNFYQRLMQFTGPLMAKGVEDTLMYTYNRFIAHNEVGDSPEAFGIFPEEFHQKMTDRQKNWPFAINTTSTHDTKRGEDVRARLNVLSDLPDEWLNKVREWQQMNKGLKENDAPDANDEYFIYQVLAGAYAMPGQDEDDFENRICEYLEKALREAKVNSDWTSPNAEYEVATKNFAVRLLEKDTPFWESLQQFHHTIADFGILNSLVQVILKFTCPGVPDVYQGTEFWDLSLVDPDNRRPVDYEKRKELLEDLEGNDDRNEAVLWKDLWESRNNANIKLWLTKTLFNERRRQADLFSKGAYVPLEIAGTYKKHVLAFARCHHQEWYLVAVPLHTAIIAQEQECSLSDLDWKDTHIILPKEAPADWQHLFLHTEGKAVEKIDVQELFVDLPFSILKLRTKNERSAGILLHITSLPSSFGIGDLGPEARKFADFLQSTDQKYWQLLPLNPTEHGQGHSPYSSNSSKAGNPFLISPELLAKSGLLDPEELDQFRLPQEDKINYSEVERVKGEIFEIAWSNFKNGDFDILRQQYNSFCQTEASWLDDFALYIALKQDNDRKPWFEWPDKYKLRDADTLEAFGKEEAETIEKTKWLQFIFSSQWKRLRTYCNNRGIRFFGDMPFYISYDSVDVWANQEIFSLDEKGTMIGVAGVPPDAFTEDGQLWGMPVFRWDVLKERNYDWWMERLRKNMELFDLVRLDHFRAFADYWEVPASEETARNGEWKLGPGADFLTFAKNELGKLPFVAEDLGDINEDVLKLRDDFALPGMKVLQFAFGDEMPQSTFIPHNYTQNFIAYTGTHDNNTILGWYRQEGKEFHSQIEQYAGRELKEEDIYWVMCRFAFASVAKTAIIPVQDLLNLDGYARMNMPGAAENNWLWRLLPEQITSDDENQLKEWTHLFNRA